MSAKSVGRPLLGLLFVVVILAGLVLAVMVYQKKFTPVVMVQLTADSIGNQLLPQSDVKLNGLIVGEVRSISDSDGKAKLALALDPDKAPLIPSNVTARFLPKTLFGEKYVALVMPDNRDTPITGGDMIKQDTSQATVEVQRVLDDLLPLLRAVPPQELSATLGAMAQALDGRGKQLGQNLTQLNTLVSSLNKQLPALKADISGLADFSDIYTAATPDLLSALANLTTTTNTVVDQRSNLDNLYSTLTGTSANLTGFLNANGANIIRLSTDSTSTLQVLARYAPDYQCTCENFTKLIPNINQAVGAGTDRPGLRLKLEVTKSRGKYMPTRMSRTSPTTEARVATRSWTRRWATSRSIQGAQWLMVPRIRLRQTRTTRPQPCHSARRVSGSRAPRPSRVCWPRSSPRPLGQRPSRCPGGVLWSLRPRYVDMR